MVRLAVFCFLVFITNANACELFINEEYTQKTYERIEHILNECKHKQITIRANSEGGLANPLLKTMDRIAEHGMVTWIVEETHVCMSACAWTAIAAWRIRGKLWFHGITDVEGRPTIDNIYLQAWLYRRGVDLAISRQMIQKDFLEIEFK